MQSPEIGALAEALSKAQGEMQSAKNNASNPFFESTYADLAAVWDACRIPLSKNGLCVVQTIDEVANGQLVLITKLIHSSGQWICGSYPLNPVKRDPQGYGSAVTYARRYNLMAIVGVAPEDDDGEIAHGRGKNRPEAADVKPPSQADYPPRQLSEDSPPTEKQKRKLFGMLREAGKNQDWLKKFMNQEFGGTIVDFESGDVSTALLKQSQLQAIYLQLDKLILETKKGNT